MKWARSHRWSVQYLLILLQVAENGWEHQGASTLLWMNAPFGGLFVSCLPHLLQRSLVSQTWQILSSLTHTRGSVMWIIYGSRAKNRSLQKKILTPMQTKNHQLSHNLPSYPCWLYVGFPPSADEIGVTVKPKATCGSDLMFIRAFVSHICWITIHFCWQCPSIHSAGFVDLFPCWPTYVGVRTG